MYVLLSLLGGILLWLAWPPIPLSFIIFFAFIPFLAIEDRLSVDMPGRSFPFIFLSFLTFLIWNALTTWWITYASLAGALMAIILNAMLMSLPAFFYHRVKKYAGRLAGYISLVAFWLCFEYMHLNWDAPWPWLNLGNVFAGSRDWIQWYEYTGALGGTLWVWIMNILLYEAVSAAFPQIFPRKETGKRKPLAPAFAAIVIFAVPVSISYIIKPGNPSPDTRHNIVAVQPNIDPYFTKFDESTFGEQINTLIKLSEQAIDSNTALVVWPETSIAEELDEQNLYLYPSIQKIRVFLSKHPNLKLLAGSNSYTVYEPNQPHSATARLFPNSDSYFDVFNSALLLDSSRDFKVYHKSKLVPGVEKMPYPKLLSFLESFAINLGGASGSLGSQDSSAVFKAGNGVKAAPVICYESIFGEYVASYVRKGANVISIITNDGWWENTPGYKQHLLYGALRAIETRRFVVRAANTGVSAFIFPSGDMIQQTGFWVPAVIKSGYVLNTEMTFYVRHGDYIARIALFVAAVFLMIALFGSLLKPYLRRIE